MTTQTNTIINKFKSEGAQKVVKDTERVGRAQTRLGQASASSGRQFAAQASGLGGLVAAYAGAAATVFALTAAFDALARAARAETIVQGTKTLALEIGQSGPRILEQVKKITQGQIELAEAAQNINIALSAGFNTDQISRLTAVSLGASRALGRNLTDALQRVVRGAAKLEPELLDELGIFTRIDPAVNKYAQRLGVAASSLSDFERRQAFVNAVIDEGERKFSSIDVASGSTQKSLEQLQVQVQTLALEFGQFIANTLLPVINFFKNNAGNTLLLFGGILALVFGKATEIIGNFAKNSLNNLSDLAAGFADSAAKAKGSTEIIQKGVKDLQKSVSEKGRGLGGEAAFTRGLTRDLSSAAADARRRFLSGEEVDSRQRAKDVETLTKAQKRLAAAGRENSAAYKDASKIIDTYSDAQKKAGFRAKALTKLSVGLQTVIRGVGRAAALAGRALNSLFFIVGGLQLIGSLFDVDILSKIRDLFIDNSQAAKDLEGGLKGLAVAAAGGGAALSNAIKEIKEDFDFEDLNAQIREFYDQIVEAQNILKIVGSSKGTPLTAVVGQRSFEAAAVQEIEKARARLNAEIEKGAKANQETIDSLKIQILLQDAILTAAQKYGLENQRLVGQLARLTGIELDKIPDTFSDAALGVDRLRGKLTIAGVEIQKIGDQYSLEGLTEEQKLAIESNIIFNATLKDTDAAFNRGAINSEKLGARLAGLTSQFNTLKESGNLTKKELEGFQEEITRTRANFEELKTLEIIGKGITQAFSGSLKALDTARFKGLVDSSGKLAKDTNEIAKNQAEFLFNTIQVNKAAFELVQNKADTDELDSIIYERAQNYTLAVKASAGEVFNIFQNTQKIIKAEEIRAIQLQNQLESLREQTDLLQLQNQLAQDQATQKAQIEALERSVNVDEKRFDLAKQITKANEDQFSAQQKLNDLKNQELQIQRDIADIQFQTQLSQAEAARGTESAQLTSSVTRQLEDPRTTAREAFELRKSLLDLERAQADDIQREQAELAERTYQNELAVIGARKVQLLTELDNLETKTQQAEIATLREKELLDQRQAIEIQKINNERDLLKQRFSIDLKTATTAIDDINRREALFEAQNKTNLAQVESFSVFLKSVQGLNEGEFVKVLSAFLKAEKGIQIESDSFAKQLITDAETSLKIASNLLTSNAALQGEIFDAERTNAVLKSKQISDIYGIEDQALANKLADTETLQKIERDALAQTQLARLAEIEAQRQQIQQQLSNEDLLGQKAYEQLQAKLLGLDIERAATEDALDLRLQSLKDEYDVIRQLNLEIAGIVKSNLTDAFMDLNTAFIEGELTFKNIASGFRDLLGSMLREIQAAVFRRTIVEPLVGSIVSAVPVFGSASGGRVQKKASGGLLRDRVPALLEPGEFVVSRRGAKAIGLANLQEINSGISDDAESILLASLFSKKVKGMQAGGPIQDLEEFGLGSEGTNLLDLLPGSSVGKAFSALTGVELPSFVVGQTAPPTPSTFKEFEMLEKTKSKIEGRIGVSPTQTKGYVPGAIDPVTGGIFNAAGQAVTIDNYGRVGAAFGSLGTPSYTSVGAFFNALTTPGNLTPLQGSIPGVPTDSFRAGGLGAGGSQYGGSSGGGGGSYGGYAGASAGSDGFGNAPRASGGMITRMASGGMMRDRVPALLEPGEFVIRRPAAKAIGGAALGAMNATGKAPSIAVNVNNQGTPKNVAVAPPKMNGDKIILDIITRDLRNNGAIKKTLRRGK